MTETAEGQGGTPITRRIRRERSARKAAEDLLEHKSLELLRRNQEALARVGELGAQVAVLERRLKRERNARKQAEQLLESKSLELFQQQQTLKKLAESLEARVLERTAELEMTRDEAVGALQDKEQFVGYVTHEIRNPLNGIFGLIDLLHRTSLNEKQQRLLDNLKRCSEHLYQVVNNVLDWVQVDDQPVSEAAQIAEIFAVEDLYVDLRAMLRGVASASKTRLMLEAPGLEESAWAGNRQAIIQVLINLVSNALRHAAGGCVTVSCAAELEDSGKGHLKFRILDDGPGLPKGFEDWLFQRFGSPEAAGLGNARSGLGLSIASRLLARHGGKIGARNRPQGGAEFYFSWPVQTSRSAPEQVAEAAATDDQVPALRILLVEDDLINIEVMREYLRLLGQHPVCAETVKEAMDLLKSGDFDLILQDMRLPDGDGLEVAQFIAVNQRTERVISISAEPPTADQQPYYQGTIRKPVTLQDLRHALREAAQPAA